MENTHRIIISETLLSDGSPVYTVILHAFDPDEVNPSVVTFGAIDHKAAIQMATDFAASAKAHSLSTIEIIDRSFV